MRIRIFLLTVLTAFVFQSCLKDKMLYTYTIARPVYEQKSVVYANIRSNAPQQVEHPGKIYLYGNYIFLSEVDKGVHIIDNSNPANPVRKAFINIPGNLDIAVKGSTLYADLYTDMVVVDITDPLAARFVRYIPQVFPHRYAGYVMTSDSSRVIVDWIRKDTTVNHSDFLNSNKADMLVFSSSAGGTANQSGAASNPTGVAGSMARVSIVGDYLYCVNNYSLLSFQLNTPTDPQKTATNNVGWNIETIYPFRNKLFIGSSNGMFIYDITNPAVPVREGQFSHARACDPVITDGNYAYVTLRDGTACTGTANQLDVVDVSNMSSPFLLKTYNLTNPHGLAKSGSYLYICDGRDGIKVYDAAAPASLSLKKHITGMNTYDAIAWNDNLLVVAEDGLYQYNISNPVSPVLRSKITVKK
ncbi:MAG TPA: hypothetical protein PLB49_14765 [Chitinophagaceae bacterium]|nr:hypothetical protein [Chitinophagaceae bacterium]HPH33119.1 hypothetical protein [Chitinophagaceae bacterium]